MTEEELEAKAVRAAELQDRKDRYKKFDFAAYVSRDREEPAAVATTPSGTALAQDEDYASLLASPAKKVSQLATFNEQQEGQLASASPATKEQARYKPPSKKGSAPRQQKQRPGLETQPSLAPSSPSPVLLPKPQSPARSPARSPTRTLGSSPDGSPSRAGPFARSRTNRGALGVPDFNTAIAIAMHQRHDGAGFSLEHLRQLENLSAVRLQRLVRMALTRRWYLNYVVRRRLSIPFSAIDFAQNPFLRQFNRVNQKLQATQGQSALAVVIKEQEQQKRGLVETRIRTRLGVAASKATDHQARASIDALQAQKRKAAMLGAQGLPEGQKPKVIRVSKGRTPDELLQGLKEDFMAHGLDAYGQFKRLGVGVGHTDAGLAYVQDGVRMGLDIRLAEQRESKAPRWIGPTDEEPGQERADVDPSRVEVSETAEYLQRAEHLRKRAARGGDYNRGAGKSTSLAARAHKIRVGTGTGSHGQPGDPGDSEPGSDEGLPGSDRSEQGQHDQEKYISALLRQKNTVARQRLIERYQKYSREPIVFVKYMGSDNAVKWTTVVGSAFIRQGTRKVYIPIRLIGQPFNARSTVLVHTMNLEVMLVTEEALKDQNFETIWPVVLYLLNNWIRHQFLLVQLRSVMPDVGREVGAQLDEVTKSDLDYISRRKEREDAMAEEGAADLLNFSSELEIDERFEDAEAQLDEAGRKVIDRSYPEAVRPPAKGVRQVNRQKLFRAYADMLQREEDE